MERLAATHWRKRRHEWERAVTQCLLRRYRVDADITERWNWIDALLARLVSKGHHRAQLEQALLIGAKLQNDHHAQQKTRTAVQAQQRLIDRARRDLHQAEDTFERLRLIPRREFANLFSSLHWLLQDADPADSRDGRRTHGAKKGGRPWQWKQATDHALKAAGVKKADRQQLLDALGFVDEPRQSE